MSQGYQRFDQYFTHESKVTNYQVFVGAYAPPVEMGRLGDICVKTTVINEVIHILTYRRRVEKPDNYEKHHIYYKTEEGWQTLDQRRHGNGKPYTTHPKIPSFCLEEFSFKWRNAANYRNSNSKTFNELNLTPRHVGLPEEQKSKKRARTSETSHSKLDSAPWHVEPSVEVTEQRSGKRAQTSENLHPPPSPENSWIIQECRRWESPPITFGTHRTLLDEGRTILQKLASLSYPVPSWPHRPDLLRNIQVIHSGTDHLKLKPDMYHVLADLIQARADGGHISIINFVLNSPADHISIEMVIKSLMLSGSRSDPAEEATQLGALTIPASSRGLGKVDLLPEQFKDCTEAVYEWKKKSNKKLVPCWGSCLIPIGAITGPHTDHCGCSQLIQHIQGRKLWLFWPPTSHNLEIYLRDRRSGLLTFSTMDAIEKLHGLELGLFDEDQTCLVVPGGTIHAVLTLTTSCHSGLKLWRTGDLETAKEMTMIQSDIMNKIENLDGNMFQFYQQYFLDLKKELKKWEELQEKGINGGVNEEIRQWISDNEEILKILLTTN